jgi:hypothetical protein
MAEALKFENKDEDGNPVQHSVVTHSSRKLGQAKKQRISTASTVASFDGDDEDFAALISSGLDDDASGSDEDLLPSNTEVSFLAYYPGLCILL